MNEASPRGPLPEGNDEGNGNEGGTQSLKSARLSLRPITA
jgi:hypothetical protein